MAGVVKSPDYAASNLRRLEPGLSDDRLKDPNPDQRKAKGNNLAMVGKALERFACVTHRSAGMMRRKVPSVGKDSRAEDSGSRILKSGA